MSAKIDYAEQLRIKRRLRSRIGRLRRRINGRLRGTQREGLRLLSLKTYVARYPAGSLAAAFGVGMATSAGLKGPRFLRWFSALLVHRGAQTILSGLRSEIYRIWEESTPEKNRADGETKAEADNG